MERQKREKNLILTQFSFYFVLSVSILFYLFSSLLPQIKQIEDLKTETKDVYSNLERVQKSGLEYEEFKSDNNSSQSSLVVKEILKGMTKDFYDKYLVNDTSSNYKDFIKKKSEELDNEENQNIVKDKSLLVQELLPSYSEDNISLTETALTDYKFVNYVESIIKSFNLTTNSPIGISKVSLVKEFSVTNNDKDSLDSNIYYIPLNLTFRGTKSGIMDFLYFIENVGNITIDGENILLNDNFGFLSKNGIKKVLEGDKLTPDYNIFKHQIIDIEKITFNDYLDTSYVSRGDEGFVDFINKTQGTDEIEVTTTLMFYVKGQPTYKIEEYINSVLDKYTKSLSIVNNLLKDPKTTGIDKLNLNKYNETLKQFNNDTINIRKTLNNKEKLNDNYKKVIKMDEIIDPIYKSINK